MKDCTTCKYGYEDERLGFPMCHHPKRFSKDCVDFNMHEEKEIRESEEPISAELEEASSKFATHTAPNGVSVEFLVEKLSFQEGAKWQKKQDEEEEADLFTIVALDAAQRAKEQMMKGAMEGIAHPDDCEIWVNLVGYGYKFNDGDKVRIIIVKED